MSLEIYEKFYHSFKITLLFFPKEFLNFIKPLKINLRQFISCLVFLSPRIVMQVLQAIKMSENSAHIYNMS